MASYQALTPTRLGANLVHDRQLDGTARKSTLDTMKADMESALKKKYCTSSDAKKPHISKINLGSKQPVDAVIEKELNAAQRSRVVEMAWEDRTTFEAIAHSYGLDEAGVIKLMRHELKPSSFRLWRQRVSNRATKHEAMRGFLVGRAYCKTQYKPR